MKVLARSVTGKQVKNMRKEGLVPASLYSPTYPTANVAVELREFRKVFADAGYSALIDVQVEGGDKEKVIIKEVQKNPVTDEVLHVSMYVTNKNVEIHTEVPVRLEGLSPAEDRGEGFAVQAMDALMIHCLPNNLPAEFVLDINALENIGDTISIGDIKLPEGVELDSSMELTSPVVYISAAQLMAEVTDEPAEGEETAETAEGEAATESENEDGEAE